MIRRLLNVAAAVWLLAIPLLILAGSARLPGHPHFCDLAGCAFEINGGRLTLHRHRHWATLGDVPMTASFANVAKLLTGPAMLFAIAQYRRQHRQRLAGFPIEPIGTRKRPSHPAAQSAVGSATSRSMQPRRSSRRK